MSNILIAIVLIVTAGAVALVLPKIIHLRKKRRAMRKLIKLLKKMSDRPSLKDLQEDIRLLENRLKNEDNSGKG